MSSARETLRYMDAVRASMQDDQAKQPWVLITGATGGLGHALAIAFADLQYNLICHDSGRHPFKMPELETHIDRARVLKKIVQGDFTQAEVLPRLIAAAGESDLIAVVNNAAIYESCPLEEMTVSEMFNMLTVNLMTPIFLTQALLPALRKRRGMIINISSMAAETPGKGETLYAATKAGLAGFGRALRLEAANARVMNVTLGALQTDMTRGRPEWTDLMAPEAVARQIVTTFRTALYERLQVAELDLRRVR